MYGVLVPLGAFLVIQPSRFGPLNVRLLPDTRVVNLSGLTIAAGRPGIRDLGPLYAGAQLERNSDREGRSLADSKRSLPVCAPPHLLRNLGRAGLLSPCSPRNSMDPRGNRQCRLDRVRISDVLALSGADRLSHVPLAAERYLPVP